MNASDFQGLRGRIADDASLGRALWFTAGGNADLLFRPEDADDLQNFMDQYPKDAPLLCLGVGSNVIIRDGGVRGAVIRLGKGFNNVTIDADTLIAGAATLDVNVAKAAAEAGLGGLSFMAGIPGTIGGAVRMNAGAYNGETKDNLKTVEILFRNGRKTLDAADLHLTYRHSELAEDAIVLSATFVGSNLSAPAILEAEILDIQARRADSQPIKAKTGGSTFANPDAATLERAGLDPSMKTWQLVDAVGARGLRCGGAMVSEKHCNFLINTGDATATDIEFLGEEVRKRVYSRFGIDLRWEIKRIGDSLDSLSPSPLQEA